MTVSGVRSSWLASAANSRCRRSATRCASSDWRIGTSARLAYAAPKANATTTTTIPPTSSVTSSCLERRDLGRAVLEGLEEVRLAVLDVGRALGQEAGRERRAAELHVDRAHVTPVLCVAGRGKASRIGHALERHPALALEADLGAGVVEREQERVAVAGLEPEPRPVVAVGRLAREARHPRVDAVLELGDARARERARGHGVERRAEHEQDDERRHAAPCHEAPADAPDEAGLVTERRLLRVVVACLEPDAVSHRRGGTPPRARSRPATRRPRASSAGSARTRRRRWASPRRRTATHGRGAGRA